MNTQNKTSSQSFDLNKLESILDLYFGKKAPAIPIGIKKFLVAIIPWFTLVGIIMGAIGLLALLGITGIALPFAFVGLDLGFNYIAANVYSVITLVIQIMAVQGLFKRQRKAWKLLYYMVLINAAYMVVVFNLGGLIIGSLLGFYVLFQIKEYYK